MEPPFKRIDEDIIKKRLNIYFILKSLVFYVSTLIISVVPEFIKLTNVEWVLKKRKLKHQALKIKVIFHAHYEDFYGLK